MGQRQLALCSLWKPRFLAEASFKGRIERASKREWEEKSAWWEEVINIERKREWWRYKKKQRQRREDKGKERCGARGKAFIFSSGQRNLIQRETHFDWFHKAQPETNELLGQKGNASIVSTLSIIYNFNISEYLERIGMNTYKTSFAPTLLPRWRTYQTASITFKIWATTSGS